MAEAEYCAADVPAAAPDKKLSSQIPWKILDFFEPFFAIVFCIIDPLRDSLCLSIGKNAVENHVYKLWIISTSSGMFQQSYYNPKVLKFQGKRKILKNFVNYDEYYVNYIMSTLESINLASTSKNLNKNLKYCRTIRFRPQNAFCRISCKMHFEASSVLPTRFARNPARIQRRILPLLA